MESRKVQKTGDMHYVYLPTNWCRKHRITSGSRLNIEEESSGKLGVYPQEKTKRRESSLNISLPESNEDLIHKLIMACYVNPLTSFRIKLEKDIDSTKLLNQKKIIGLESVEIDENIISSESSVHLSDPDLLLITMVKKIKNLLFVMTRDYNKELIERYEEEIDRSKMHIEKSIISFLTLNTPINLNTIDLYYIALLSRDLERVVDHLIRLEKTDSDFLEQLIKNIDLLRLIMESLKTKKRFDYKMGLEFVKEVDKIRHIKARDIRHYDKRRIKGLLSSISETVLDWAVTLEIDKP